MICLGTAGHGLSHPAERQLESILDLHELIIKSKNGAALLLKIAMHCV